MPLRLICLLSFWRVGFAGTGLSRPLKGASGLPKPPFGCRREGVFAFDDGPSRKEKIGLAHLPFPLCRQSRGRGLRRLP